MALDRTDHVPSPISKDFPFRLAIDNHWVNKIVVMDGIGVEIGIGTMFRSHGDLF